MSTARNILFESIAKVKAQGDKGLLSRSEEVNEIEYLLVSYNVSDEMNAAREVEEAREQVALEARQEWEDTVAWEVFHTGDTPSVVPTELEDSGDEA